MEPGVFSSLLELGCWEMILRYKQKVEKVPAAGEVVSQKPGHTDHRNDSPRECVYFTTSIGL